MNKPFIVLQQSGMGKPAFLSTLRTAGLDPEKFDIHTMPDPCSQAIIPGTDQVLILGTIEGSICNASGFVSNMKEKNPRLIAIGYCRTGNIEGCVVTVDKKADDAPHQLAAAIRKYAEAML